MSSSKDILAHTASDEDEAANLAYRLYHLQGYTPLQVAGYISGKYVSIFSGISRVLVVSM
jgi:hypothetical protein